MKHNYEDKNNGIISSDDPNALAKLREKLAGLEKIQEMYKGINRVVRSKKLGYTDQIEELVKLGIVEGRAIQMLEPDRYGRVGIPGYKLTNNNQNMNTVRERIKKLEKLSTLESKEEVSAGVRIVTNVEANRLQFIFEGKPEEAIRRELKSHGFHWSPTEGAWQRMLPVQSWVIDSIKKTITPVQQAFGT